MISECERKILLKRSKDFRGIEQISLINDLIQNKFVIVKDKHTDMFNSLLDVHNLKFNRKKVGNMTIYFKKRARVTNSDITHDIACEFQGGTWDRYKKDKSITISALLELAEVYEIDIMKTRGIQ